MITEAYPLQWPLGWKRTSHPGPSSFGYAGNKPTIHRATQELLRQIQLLPGTNIVVSSELRVRKDGLPVSGQRQPTDPGIAVYFTLDNEQKVIACDTYDRCGCNIWAVAKTVDALRGIQRWGASELLTRAFSGFKALPQQASPSSVRAWYEILEVAPECTIQELKVAYRQKVKRYHPDRVGENEYFLSIQQAYQQGLIACQVC